MAPSLPFELIIKVIEHAYYSKAHGPYVDIKTLSACTAVCKQWHSFARNLSFFEFVLTRLKSDRFLAGNISLLAGPGGFGACIRSITLYDRGPCGMDFITVLSHCPALYDLKLSLTNIAVELSKADVARLAALTTKIQALTLNISYPTAAVRVLYQLLAIWPSIQSLRSDDLECMARPPAERPPFSLFELALSSRHPSPEHILRWLLPPIPAGQRGSLDILSVTFEIDAGSVLNEYAPYVRSLRLSCMWPCEQLQEIIARFSALEELIMGDTFAAREFRTPANAPALPQTIRHLWISAAHGERMSSVRYVLALLDSSDVPRLARVSVDGSDSDHWQLVDLAQMCADKGVELVINASHSFNNSDYWKMEYPVPVGRFPRDWTIENLYRMKTGG